MHFSKSGSMKRVSAGYIFADMMAPLYLIKSSLTRFLERFIRKLMPDEIILVLLFNWNLSSHQFSLIIRKEVQSIYLDLRKV